MRKVRGLVINHTGNRGRYSGGGQHEYVRRLVRVVQVNGQKSVDFPNWDDLNERKKSAYAWIKDAQWVMYTGTVKINRETVSVVGFGADGLPPLVWANSTDAGWGEGIAASQWIGSGELNNVAHFTEKYDLKVLE